MDITWFYLFKFYNYIHCISFNFIIIFILAVSITIVLCVATHNRGRSTVNGVLQRPHAIPDTSQYLMVVLNIAKAKSFHNGGRMSDMCMRVFTVSQPKKYSNLFYMRRRSNSRWSCSYFIISNIYYGDLALPNPSIHCIFWHTYAYICINVTIIIIAMCLAMYSRQSLLNHAHRLLSIVTRSGR